jgi:CDP-alcohol phosphatidyltransferase
MEKSRWWPKLPHDPGDWEFTSILLGRPIAAFILYPFKKNGNPNIVTLISLVFSLVTCFFYWFKFSNWLLFGSLFLFFSMVLDDGDGLLARYQKKSSNLGSMLDKFGDIIRFGLLFPVLGYLAYFKYHNSIFILLGAMSSIGLLIQGYTKWVYEAHALNFQIKNSSKNDELELDKDKKQNSTNNKKTTNNYLKGITVSILWPFHECDLTLWIIILMYTGNLKLLLIIMSISQMTAGVLSIFSRLYNSYRLDKNR